MLMSFLQESVIIQFLNLVTLLFLLMMGIINGLQLIVLMWRL